MDEFEYFVHEIAVGSIKEKVDQDKCPVCGRSLYFTYNGAHYGCKLVLKYSLYCILLTYFKMYKARVEKKFKLFYKPF